MKKWSDTDFETGVYPTYRELNWLHAARWLVTEEPSGGEWPGLADVRLPVPFDFSTIDVIELIRAQVPDVPKRAPEGVRLLGLIGLLKSLGGRTDKYHLAAAAQVIRPTPDLMAIEQEVKQYVLELPGKAADALREHEMGTLCEKLIEALIEVQFARTT